MLGGQQELFAARHNVIVHNRAWFGVAVAVEVPFGDTFVDQHYDKVWLVVAFSEEIQDPVDFDLD
jgi:hypothetical protein